MRNKICIRYNSIKTDPTEKGISDVGDTCLGSFFQDAEGED